MKKTVVALALSMACRATTPDTEVTDTPEATDTEVADTTDTEVADTDAPDTDAPPVGAINCTPPPLLRLADIPDAAGLAEVDSNVLASFEVDGDNLIGKYVRDTTKAEGALLLWRELVLRIPTNQRAQLVQFTLYESGGNSAYVDNSGINNQTGRYGQSLFVNDDNIDDNDPDVCAPLSGRRGTWDWTLIHEFGHIRQYADGATDDFVETFGGRGGGEWEYPEDGSPLLTGDFVSSYAQRAQSDEDAAESFTTYIMLDSLPTETSLAADKVRFFDSVPDYPALRQALRVTEPGGGGTVPDAPLRTYGIQVTSPDWLVGTWEGAGPEGPVTYIASADNLIFRGRQNGADLDMDYANLDADGELASVLVIESNESFHLLQVAFGDMSYSETFELQGETVLVSREGLGTFTITRAD